MRDIRPLKIISIIKPAGFGGTKPIIVRAEDEKLYVLKTREDGTNPKDLGVFNETLAYLLHDEMGFGISPQNVCYLYIDDGVVDMVFDAYTQNIIEKESYEYIKDSKGFNVGVEYIEDAMEIKSEKMNKTFVRDTIRLDNYILNCDRVEGANSNILQDKKDRRKYYAIDYGNALADAILYEKIVSGEDISEHLLCNLPKSSGRYIFKNSDELMNYKKTTQSIDTFTQILLDLIATMPPDWEPLNYKEIIANAIAKRIKSKKIFDKADFIKCECLY